MERFLYLQRLEHERDRFELLLNRVGFLRRMTIKGVSGRLSVKDLLADILAREQFLVDRLTDIHRGDVHAPSTTHAMLEGFRSNHGYPDYESPLVASDKPDPQTIDKYRSIELEEIVAQELAAYSGIRKAFDAISHADCLDHGLYQRLTDQTYRPYRRTAKVIHHWLRSTFTEVN